MAPQTNLVLIALVPLAAFVLANDSCVLPFDIEIPSSIPLSSPRAVFYKTP